MSTFGDRLRLLREEKGYSQAELAELMGLNRMTINNYENEKRKPDIAFAIDASEHFGVTLEYLTGRSEFRSHEDILDSVEKYDRLIKITEKLPQIEMRQLMDDLAQLLEEGADRDIAIPILMSVDNAISEYQKLADGYGELKENIERNAAELKWQGVQPLLIHWTCSEKAKAIYEKGFEAGRNILESSKSCSKMLSNKLLKILETEEEK